MGRFGLAVLTLCLLDFPVDAMDQVRKELGADKAAADFKATGEGVLVAIMDRGIDWLNDDFRNEDASTRIRYLFDLIDDSGAKAPDYPYKV